MMRSVFGKRYLFYYTGVWAIIMIAHFLIFRFAFGIGNEQAMADSFVFNGLFAVLGIGLAFMMRFSDLSRRSVTEQLFYHLTGAAVTVLVWMSASSAILRYSFPISPQYLEFLGETVTVRIISGILFYVALIAIHYLLIKMKELSDQQHKEEELRSLLRETELNALRSQIRPHFLFNSLNSISSLTVSNPQKARDMVIKLAEFMRYSLNIADQPMSTVEKELYHVQLYLDIEKVRFGERLDVATAIEKEILSHDMPSMTLQPLMENAVKYGVYESTDNVIISLSIHRVGDMVTVEMVNPDHGIKSRKKGTGTGLKNIRARMINIYGRDDLLSTYIKDGYFHAILKLPENE